MGIKIGFWGAVSLMTSLLVVILANMPTIIDLLAAVVWSVGGVWVGRKSKDLF